MLIVWHLTISRLKIYQENSKKIKKSNSNILSQIHNGRLKMQKNAKFQNFAKMVKNAYFWPFLVSRGLVKHFNHLVMIWFAEIYQNETN